MAKRGADEQITKDGRRDDSDDENEEDPGVRVQPLAPVEGRAVRPMPKRKGMGSGVPSAAAPAAPVAKPAFSGFSFGAPPGPAPTTGPAFPPPSSGGFTFGGPAPAASATPSAPAVAASAAPPKPFGNFSFGAPASQPAAPPAAASSSAQTPQHSGGFGGFQPSSAPAPPAAPSAPNPVVAASINGSETPGRPTPSQETPPPEGEVAYYTSIRGLNAAILSFLTTTIVNDPFIDLSTALPDLGSQYAKYLDKAASSSAWRPATAENVATAENGIQTEAPKPAGSFEGWGATAELEGAKKAVASMPAPPAAPSWVLKPTTTPQPAAAGTGFVPTLPASSGGSSPFSFGNFGQPAEPIAKPAESTAPPAVSERPKPKSPSEAEKMVEDILSDKPEPSAAPSNPFAFSVGSSTPSNSNPAGTPSAETKKPLFPFAPSGPIHPSTPGTKTFSPSKTVEDPSPAKLGKFGPGGSQPQLSFGGARPGSQSSTPPAARSFSFGAAVASGAASAPGFTFGSASATPAAAPASSFSFGTAPTPSFSFGAAATADPPKPPASSVSFGSSAPAPAVTPSTAAPAFSFKPFGGAPVSSNPSSSSITSAPAAADAGGDDAPPDAGSSSVDLAASAGEGEENEDTVFEQRARLHRLVEGSWKPVGLGLFKLKKAKGGGKRRFLMRTDGAAHVLLNMTLSKTLKPSTQKSNIMFLGFDLEGKPASYRLQVKTAEMAEEIVAKTLAEVEAMKTEGS